MTRPLVSIVIPSYNHERYISECIQSVIDQDYKRIELLIIDDGSKDNSVEKIESLVTACERRFERFEFRVQKNKGLCETLNEGIRWSRGDFFSAIASDDSILPFKTSVQVEYLDEATSCSGVFGGALIIDDEGRLKSSSFSKKGVFRFRDVFLKKKYFFACTQFLRLDALKAAGPFPRNLFIEDWYMWLKLTHQGGRLGDIGVPVARYRIHASNSSRNAANMNDARMEILKSYRNEPGYKLALSICILSSALDLPDNEWKKRIFLLFEALRYSPLVLFNRHFYATVARFLRK